MEVNMLIFDTETTGLVENMTTRLDHQPEIIEFCGITIDPYNGKVYDILDTLIKPSVPITVEITKMNNITNPMVERAPHFKELAKDIRDLIERSDAVVAHNAMFDVNMIDLEFMRLGTTPVAWPPIICTIEATIHLTGYRLSLAALHNYLFKKPFDDAHRARADVEALARCVVKMRKDRLI
jgi:DNA polymerase III epsilon subunit-like protein